MLRCHGYRNMQTISASRPKTLNRVLLAYWTTCDASRCSHDPEYEIFTKRWMDGAREIQQGYLPKLHPKGVKLRREATDNPQLVTQWLSDKGATTLRQVAKKWGVRAEAVDSVMEGLFNMLIEAGLLISVRLKGARGRPLPNIQGVYQVNGDRLKLQPHHGIWRCKSCRRTTPRRLPKNLCPYWRCQGQLVWVRRRQGQLRPSVARRGLLDAAP